ncbi:MAG: hypothetical protein ACTSP7_11890, partial [Candidatus Heimdallarchaeota archaeon]
MKEEIIQPGQTVELDVVDGNLRVGDGAILEAKKETILVKGNIVSHSSIRCKRGALDVEGDLKVAKYVDIDKSLVVSGSAICPDINIGGTLKVQEDIQSQEVKIGGTMKIGGKAAVETIRIGGTLKIHGDSNIGEIKVGGSVKLGGTTELEKLKVGGTGTVISGKI